MQNQHKLITRTGMVLEKNKLKRTEITKIKKQLTVTPHIHPDYVIDKPDSWELFTESENTITVPRFYGVKEFNTNNINFKDEVEPSDMKFNFELRDSQQPIANACLKDILNLGGGVISLPCGFGKCMAKGTPVVMYNGLIKNVEDVIIGDKLLGDDSEPRNVLSVCTGTEQMYKVTDVTSQTSYTVNRSHILSLKYISTSTSTSINSYNTVDISVKDYLKLSTEYRSKLKGYRVKVDFPYKHVSDTPYSVGKSLKITHDYKCNSEEVRFRVLLGVVDTYGSYNDNDKGITLNLQIHTLTYKQKLTALEDVVFIARSLGFYVHIDVVNFQVCIKDDDNDLLYDIEVTESVDTNTYYGFEIDGNRRYLLGDFTVTHNTVIALWLACQLKVKTLVVVHKTFLSDQWYDRIKQFTDARIGVIRQKRKDVKDKDIVIGMLQSISMIDYDPKIFDGFGCIIFDEAHHCASRVFCKALQKLGAKYMIGLSATPTRSDKLEKVLYWYVGNIIYRLERKAEDNTCFIRSVTYESDDKHYKEKKQWFNGSMKPAIQRMITDMYKVDSRNRFIVSVLNQLTRSYERKTLVLSARLEHLKILKEQLDRIILERVEKGEIDEGEITTSYYIGKMRAGELEIATEADVIFATYAMAEEALDIDKLNTLVLATPKLNIQQSIGRILRKPIKEGDIPPIVIDIVDLLSCFGSWSSTRNLFYKKQKYEITEVKAFNDQLITVKQMLYNKKIITKQQFNSKKLDVRKEYMIHYYGKDHYELQEELEFENDPYEKYDKVYTFENLIET